MPEKGKCNVSFVEIKMIYRKRERNKEREREKGQ